MAHKTLIGGTAYEISGGRTLVNGTGYSIDKGKTLVGGTVYEVRFGVPCTVTILANGLTPNGNANVTLNGQTYSAKGVSVSIDQNNPTMLAKLTVPSGTVMHCSALVSTAGTTTTKGTIVLNGTFVAEGATGVPATYDYVVNDNIQVNLYDSAMAVSNIYVSQVVITEIPEGHALVNITNTYTTNHTQVVYNGNNLATGRHVIPIGSILVCTAYTETYAEINGVTGGSILVNGQKVADETYNYTVTGNVNIDKKGDRNKNDYIAITEQ